jgi:hypothetical protein
MKRLVKNFSVFAILNRLKKLDIPSIMSILIIISNRHLGIYRDG